MLNHPVAIFLHIGRRHVSPVPIQAKTIAPAITSAIARLKLSRPIKRILSPGIGYVGEHGYVFVGLSFGFCGTGGQVNFVPTSLTYPERGAERQIMTKHVLISLPASHQNPL